MINTRSIAPSLKCKLDKLYLNDHKNKWKIFLTESSTNKVKVFTSV